VVVGDPAPPLVEQPRRGVRMANINVVGVDGREPSLRAARRAGQLAAHLGATLHVVTALDTATVEEFPNRPGPTLVTSGELAESIAADAARELAAVVGNVTSAVAYGKPAVALVDEAVRLEARLIVVGNRRVQGISRVLGSVASGVAAHAPCDVYIARTV
jgi:nucleotide-binding universal stress UspA family protein